MPFETDSELQRLKAAIEVPEVAKNPADFAIGTLHYYQTKFEKIRRRAIEDIYKQLTTLDPFGPEYPEKMEELNALELRPDWGFYYTIFLFDQLNNPSASLINTMIQAALSFDTLGNYISEEQPIIIALLGNQNETVILRDILKRRRIDVVSLNFVAQQNRNNTMYFLDSTIPANIPLPRLTSVYFLTKINLPLGKTSSEWSDLLRYIEEAKAVEVLRKRIAQARFPFDLLSQEPTPENIYQFFKVVAEIFNHAKMQDSAKLFTLNAAPYPNAKASKSSTVALLQDTLPSWFVLSLIQAGSKDVFNQRLAFITAVINTATQKEPTLPPNTSADVFLPLFQFAAYIDKSVLQFHPVLKSSLSHIQAIALKRSPDDITKVISVKIPPMRMVTTNQLVLNSEIGAMINSGRNFVDKLSLAIAKLTPASGTQPLTGAEISQITEELSEIVAVLSQIIAELFLPIGELPRISAELLSIAKGTGDAVALSRIASELTPIAQKISCIAEAKKIMTQGRIIYNYFNPEYHMVSQPQLRVSGGALDVFKQQSTVKVLFEGADFRDMQNLLAGTFIVFQSDKSIGRQLSTLHNCLNLDSPRIYSLRDKKLFEGRGALDFIAHQAKRISDQVSSQDEEYKIAVKSWCVTILEACQQVLYLASGQMLARVSSASSQDGGSRTLLDFFSSRRARAISEPPLPKTSLDQAKRASDFKASVSCPASVAGGRRASDFAHSRVGSDAHELSLSDQVFSQCKK